MNLLPKRRPHGLARRSEFDDLFSQLSELMSWAPMRLPTMENLPEVFTTGGFPRLETEETEEAYHVHLDLPGMDEDDVEVELMNHRLRIHGEREWKSQPKDRDDVRSSASGKFEHVLTLPENLKFDAEAVQARLAKGVLHVEVPKLEPTPATKIRVNAK